MDYSEYLVNASKVEMVFFGMAFIIIICYKQSLYIQNKSSQLSNFSNIQPSYNNWELMILIISPQLITHKNFLLINTQLSTCNDGYPYHSLLIETFGKHSSVQPESLQQKQRILQRFRLTLEHPLLQHR